MSNSGQVFKNKLAFRAKNVLIESVKLFQVLFHNDFLEYLYVSNIADSSQGEIGEASNAISELASS